MNEVWLHDLFEPFGPVSTRRMSGGIGVYSHGVMFALVADDTVYMKADRETERSFEQAGSEPFTYEGKGKPVRMSYWRLPEEAYEEPDRLRAWAERALESAQNARRVKTPPDRLRPRRRPPPASAP